MRILSVFVLVAFASLPQEPAQSPVSAEGAVASTLEELRKAELVLDADALAGLLAYSFTAVEKGSRVSGSFAYVEPMRRLRERGGIVKELRFEQPVVRVFGASAVASYQLRKAWVDRGARHRHDGWSTDVFEKRDDGAWVLVHRHRP